MLEKHLTGICNYFENRITNGLTEGMNTKIKLIKRKSYGFANFEYLRLKLLACFNSYNFPHREAESPVFINCDRCWTIVS